MMEHLNKLVAESKLWHLCTPGNFTGILFKSKNDFIYGMNMVALSAHKCEGTAIYTFELMNNHVHFVLEGEEANVRNFYDVLKRNCLRLWNANAGNTLVKKLQPKLFRIDSLRYLQNVIVYVNRNGYVIDNTSTPFSYPWGTNAYFFNGLKQYIKGKRILEFTIDEKRELFRKRDVEICDEWEIIDGYVSPDCYCKIADAEKIYHNAHHYFSVITKGVESFKEIAAELGDDVFYTDNDLYRIVAGICMKEYNVKDPSMLGSNHKIQIAIRLKKEYNASGKQLMRLLKLERSVIAQLFPKTNL